MRKDLCQWLIAAALFALATALAVQIVRGNLDYARDVDRLNNGSAEAYYER